MSPPTVLRFDRFELRPAQQLLLRDGQPVPLGTRAFDLLVALAERAGRLVTKDELLDAVWPGLVVEQNNIATQIVVLRKALDSRLIVTVPGRGYRFTGQVQVVDGAAPQPASPGPAAPASPVASSHLVGRDDDLAQLQALLARPGCCTLVGPGGVGKTALARAVFHAAPTPRLWLDLAALDHADQLPAALQRATDGAAPGAVRLLVLDNAEHLVDAVAATATSWLGANPALHLLVTSQVPLAIAGEQVWRLPPLQLPASDMADVQALATPAVALLIDRIRASQARWQPGPGAAALLRRLCTELDGLPLALEMAAARVTTLGLQAVCDGLAERFALLRRGRRDAPDRHQTLQATLQWSERLLDADELRLLQALGVFVGGFTLELAVAVAGDDGDSGWNTIDRLAALVERSLVMVGDSDPPRYRLLESTRLHALQRLAESGAGAAVQARHAAALDRLFAAAQDTPLAAADPAAQAAALAEMDNLRAALTWARRHDAALALRLAVQAAAVATFTPWRADALQWLQSGEPLLAQADAPLQAQWWTSFATQALFARSPRTTEAARQAVALCRQATDDRRDWRLLWALIALARSQPAADAELAAALDEMQRLLQAHPDWRAQARAVALGTLALAAKQAGDLDAALRHRQAELALVQQAGLRQHLGVAANNLAYALYLLGRHDEALQQLQDYLAQEPEHDGHNALFARGTVLRVLFSQGRFDAALALAPPLLAAARRQGTPWVLEVLTLGVAQAGRHHDAALLLGHVGQVLQARGLQADEAADGDLARTRALVQGALGDAALHRLQQQGQALDPAAADLLLLGRGPAAG